MNDKGEYISQITLRLLQTEKGFLHKHIKEYDEVEEGELNYTFTDDPFQAYMFYTWSSTIPKYLDMYADFPLIVEQDVCNFLNGRIVEVKIQNIIRWEI